MLRLFKRLALGALLLMGMAEPVAAQISIPNSFVTRQVISSSKMNANFNQLGLQALNRTAPVLQATVTVDTDAVYDLGAVATRFRNAYLSGQLNPGSIQFATSVTYPGAGSLSRNAVSGIVISAQTGSSFDLVIANPAGTSILNVPTGTLNTVLGGNLTVNGTGISTFAGTIQVTTNSTNNAPGMISKHANNGLFITGATGATFDFALMNPSGASAILFVPTGTVNAGFNGLISVGGAGTNTFNAAVAGIQSIQIRNTSNNAAALAQLAVGNDVDGSLGLLNAYSSTTATSGLAAASTTVLRSNGGLNIGTTGSAATNFFTNATQRWGINTAGDFTNGASNHIALSSGTPTISSGAGSTGTIVGTDYGFVVTVGGSGIGSSIVVNFGHTFNGNVFPLVNIEGPVSFVSQSTSTTQYSVTLSGAPSPGSKIYVHILGS